MTTANSSPAMNSQTHDFIAHVSSINFDFSGYNWEESFESEAEWTTYQEEISSRHSTFSVYFKDYDLPESDDEDETIDEFYESTHCREEGYCYRVLERWIDEEIGWLFRDLEYSIDKVYDRFKSSLVAAELSTIWAAPPAQWVWHRYSATALSYALPLLPNQQVNSPSQGRD